MTLKKPSEHVPFYVPGHLRGGCSSFARLRNPFFLLMYVTSVVWTLIPAPLRGPSPPGPPG